MIVIEPEELRFTKLVVKARSVERQPQIGEWVEVRKAFVQRMKVVSSDGNDIVLEWP